MGDLDPLPGPGEHHRMLAHRVAAADRLESDGLAVAHPRVPFPAVDGTAREVAPQRIGDDLAHPHRGAGGRIDLVAMVHLDDLDVRLLAEDAARNFNEMKAGVDTDAHVRSDEHGNVRRTRLDPGSLLDREPRGSDHELRSGRATALGEGHRPRGEAEVDDPVDGAEEPARIVRHLDSIGPRPGERARVGAERLVAGLLRARPRTRNPDARRRPPSGCGPSALPRRRLRPASLRWS